MEKLIETAGPFLGSLAVGGVLSLATIYLLFRFLGRSMKALADALTRIAVSNEAIVVLAQQTNKRLDSCVDGHQNTAIHLTRIEWKLDGSKPNGGQKPPFPVV